MSDAVEDIKSRLSIEDVISQYLELKRDGRGFKALSPFSNEKTPSFKVSPEKQIWHDFSSEKGGNMFTFVMEMEGVDFKGALEILARQAGVDLSQYQRGDSSRSKQKERLYATLELAAKFYQVQLSKHRPTLEYIIKKRSFSKQTILQFRLGYAPKNDNSLTRFLLNKKFTPTEIRQAGLATQRYDKLADMFRGRLIVPLQDPTARVIGFTARLLTDEPNAPKYINTPQTILYDKSRHIFGLHLAKEAIRQSKYVVVVEGNLDVIASHQAGVKQAVATAGTAVTEQHLKALTRFTPDIRLAFDQDRAGLNATERVIPIASKVGANLSMIIIENAKDPDELIQKEPSAWQKAIDKPVYALDWLISRYQQLLDLNSAVGKRQFSDVIVKVIGRLSDPVEQSHYISRVSQLLGVSQEALEAKLKSQRPSTFSRRRQAQPPVADPRTIDQLKAQNHLLALTLARPELRDYLKRLTPDMLINDDARKMLKWLQSHLPEQTKVIQADGVQGAAEERSEAYKEYVERVPQAATQQSAASNGSIPSLAGKQAVVLDNLGDYGKILVLLYEELYQGLETLELSYEAARLQTRLIEHYVKTQKAVLTPQLRLASDPETEKLLQKVKALDDLLKHKEEPAHG